MVEVKMDALRQQDNLIQHLILPDYNYVGELLSVFPICMKYQETEMTNEYEKLKEAHREMVKLYIQFEDRTKHYHVLMNNCVKKFQDFGILFKNQSKSNEDVIAALKSENDNLKNELKSLRHHNSTLKANRKEALQLLIEEKLQREQIETDRKNLEYLSEKLCSILLKYQQPVHQHEGIQETTTRASCDNLDGCIIESDSDLVLNISSSTSENCLDENNFSDICSDDDVSLISPSSNYRDDDTSPIANDSDKELSGVTEPRSAVSEEASTNLTSSVPQRTPSPSILESDVTDESLPTTQEFHSNPSENNAPDLTILERTEINGLKLTTPDSATRCILPEPIQTNETSSYLQNSENSNKRTEESVSRTDELPNSSSPGQSRFTSDTDGKSFLEKSVLVGQTNVSINSSQSFNCKKCGESLMSKKKGQRLAKCTNCDVRYNTGRHKNKFESISGSFETKKNGISANVDIRRECEKGNSNARCEICGKRFSGKSTLKRHIRDVHEVEKPYDCITCGKRFAQKAHLKTHTAVHSSDRAFKCSFCNEYFKYSGNKRTHERVIHDGYAPFQCAHCDKRCSRKDRLISHIFSQHFSLFKCTICDQRFKLHSIKLQHERMAHGENDRFHCAECEKSFAFKRSLSRHFRKIHV